MEIKHRITSQENNFGSLLKTSLKGISQVILIENAITGFIILLAISISSISLGIITLLSAVIGTLIGKFLGADEDILNQGLLGYNSVLTGMALTLFLSGPYHWIIALAGAATTAIFTASMMHLMKKIELPVLTFPFILMTWFMLLVSYRLTAFTLSPELVPQSLAQWELDIEGEVNLVQGIFNGIGQIFFLDNTISGVLLFLAVFWADWKIGIYAILGNAVSLITSYGLGGEHSLIFIGLYGYNAILATIAVSTVFKNEGNRYALLSGIIVASLSVLATASVSSWLLPFGLPTLTMPFVIVTWIFLGARKVLPLL